VTKNMSWLTGFGQRDVAGRLWLVSIPQWFDVPEFKVAFDQFLHPGQRGVLVYIPTAMQTPAHCDRDTQYREQAEIRRQRLGFTECVILDFETASIEDAKMLLADADVDCLYVEGGNTFALRHFARPFDSIIQKALKTKGMPLIGVSAGAIMCGATIETALWKGHLGDEPNPPGVPRREWGALSEARRWGAAWDVVGGNTFFMHFGDMWRDVVRISQSSAMWPHPTVTIDNETVMVFNVGSSIPSAVIRCPSWAMKTAPAGAMPQRYAVSAIMTAPPAVMPQRYAVSNVFVRPIRV